MSVRWSAEPTASSPFGLTFKTNFNGGSNTTLFFYSVNERDTYIESEKKRWLGTYYLFTMTHLGAMVEEKKLVDYRCGIVAVS